MADDPFAHIPDTLDEVEPFSNIPETVEQTTALGAFGRSAATGAAPATGAAVGGALGWGVGLALAPETGGLSLAIPLLGMLTGGALGAGVTDVAQRKALEAAAPETAARLKELQELDVAQHPVASLGGRLAANVPTFAFAPGQTLRGVAAIPSVISRTATPAQTQAAASAALQLGLGAGTGVVVPLARGEKPTLAGVGEAALQSLIFGQPRAKVLIPRSLRALSDTPHESFEPYERFPGAGFIEPDPFYLYQTRAQRIRPTQAEPVILGGRARAAELAGQEPEIVGPRGEIVPATQAVTAPGKTEAGGEISFGATAEAEAIPSARQTALQEMVEAGFQKEASGEEKIITKVKEIAYGKDRLVLEEMTKGTKVGKVTGLSTEADLQRLAQSRLGELKSGKADPELDFIRRTIEKQEEPAVAETVGKGLPAPQEPSPQALGITPPGMQALGQIVEMFKPKAQAALPRTVSTAGEALPDLGDRSHNKAIATDPTGIGRIPLLNWLFDPRHRAKTAPEKSLLTFFYEQGVGQAQVKALGSTFGTRFKQLFPRNEAGEFTTVGRTKAGQSLHPTDVFEGLQRDPNSYRLTPEQRQAFDELMRYEKRARELEAKYRLYENPETGQVEPEARPSTTPYYTRGMVVGKPRRPGGMGGGSTGGRQFFQKARAFETEQEGVNKGFRYPMNVDDRILIRLSKLYKAIADRRLAEDPDLGGRWGSETGPLTYHEGQVFQPAFKSGVEYRIFPVEVAQKINSSLGAQQTAWLKALSSVNDFFKSVQLGFDWGAGQIQGLPTAFRDPKAWANAQLTSLKAFGNKDAFAAYLRTPENAQAIRELAEFGSGIGMTPEMIAGLGEGGAVSAVPKIVGKSFEQAGFPRVGKAIARAQEAPQAFGRLFTTFLDVAKIEKWKSRREITPREEWPRAIQEIEHELNMGRMETIGVSPTQALAERIFLLAPSYYRGGLSLIGDMMAKGVTGAQARRAMGSYMGGIIALFGAGALASGMPWEEIRKRLLPSSGNFLMFPVKLGDKSIEVGFGGIMRSWMRLIGNTIKTSVEHPENWKSFTSEKNPFVKWLRGHSSPVVSKAWDLFFGEDYTGEDADLTSLARGSFPLSIQSWLKQERGQTGGQTAADIIFSFAGLLSWPQNAQNNILIQRNRLAREKFNTPYENLKIRQQAAVQRALERTPEFINKPRSTNKQIEQAFRHQVERQQAVQSGLEAPIREVITNKELHVPGFEPTLKIGPTEIFLTQAQMDRYKALLIEEYNRVLKNRLSILRNATSKRGQDLLADWTEQAKARARARLQAEFNR